MSRYRPFLLLALLCAGLLLGCHDNPPPLIASSKALPSEIIDGFPVPVFPTPEEQLNYTHSWFESQQEKKAALTAVANFFPEARKQQGAAALELSFLRLGPDYRLATPADCREAIDNYRRIIKDFHDQPEVGAKAYWYMGWIFSDLLKDHLKAIEMYRIVVADYPEIRLNRPSTLPWATFVTPSEPEAQQATDDSNPFWSDLALIQIIRTADDAGTIRNAFMQLRNGRQNSRLVGMALKILLQHPDLDQEAAPFVQDYLQDRTAEPVLQNDIRLALHNRPPQPAGKEKETAR